MIDENVLKEFRKFCLDNGITMSFKIEKLMETDLNDDFNEKLEKGERIKIFASDLDIDKQKDSFMGIGFEEAMKKAEENGNELIIGEFYNKLNINEDKEKSQ